MTPLTMIGQTYTQKFKARTGFFGSYAETVFADYGRCIVGVPNKGGGTSLGMVECSDTSLLISLLSLYEQMKEYELKDAAETMDQDDVGHIIEWCRANGLPFESAKSEEDSLWLKHRAIGFNIANFYARLNDLYTAYLLWRRVYNMDSGDTNFYSRNHISVEQCKESLHVRMLTMRIRVSPDFSTEPPRFFLECDDLMDAAKAQLFFLCMATDSSVIGVCSVCGTPFRKMRKNHVLCENCQRTKYQRSRDKKRTQEYTQEQSTQD